MSTAALKDKIAQVLQTLDAELIASTQKIISFQTVSGGTAEQEAKYQVEIPACFEWLKALSEKHGFTFRHWDNEVAEIEWAIASETKRPVMGIAAHIDVVTPAGNWKYGPFDGTIADGILYGRGIEDDKGPLIQAFYGMVALKQAGVVPACDIRFIIGTREETGDWTDVFRYVKERGAPDFGFTPDAEFPIITGEKGMMNLSFTANWEDTGADAETGLQFMKLKGGERTNIIPSLAETVFRFPLECKDAALKELFRETTRFQTENDNVNLTLVPMDADEAKAKGYFEMLVSFIGKNAHSSTPEYGHNAIVDAANFFKDIETLPDPIQKFIQFIALSNVDYHGTSLGFASEHDFVGKTTSTVTMIEITPTGGMFSMNTRPTMGMDTVEVLKKAQQAAQVFKEATGFEITVEIDGKHLNASYLDPNKPGVGEFISGLCQAFELVTGQAGVPMSIGGTTYAKALPNCCAFGPVLIGVDKELAHQADEHLAVDSIRRNALIYGMSIAFFKQG